MPRSALGAILFALVALVVTGLAPELATAQQATSPFTVPFAPLAVGCPAVPNDAYTNAVLADAPLVYYPLNESTGTTMCDDSGHGNDGTYSTSGISYGIGGPLSTDTSQTGVGDVPPSTPNPIGASRPTTGGLSGNQSFTLEGWFKSTTPTNEVLVGLTVFGGTTDGLAVWQEVGAPSSACNNGTDVFLALDEYGQSNCWDATSAGVNPRDGGWHYLAIAYDASATTVTAYADGHDLGAQTSNNTFNWTSAAQAMIGDWVDTGVNQSFTGDAAQLAIYGTALSTARIDAHYQAASTTQTRYTVSSTIPVEPGPGGNTVTAADTNPDASCGSGSCTVDAGDTVTLTANPAAGYRFANWAGNGDPCFESTKAVCTVSNVQGDVNAIAQFLYIQPPTVGGYAVTSVRTTGATITAHVQPHGLATTYALDYGRSTAYGQTLSGGTFTGGSDPTVSFTLTGLLPSTLYNFKVVATSSGGTTAGGNGAFTTGGPPPPLAAPVLSNVSGALTGLTSAAASGDLDNPPYVGASVSYYVEYAMHAYYLRASHNVATPDPYNQKTTTKTVTTAHGRRIRVTGVLGTLSGLASGTTYDFRVVATSNDTTNVAYSSNQTVTTPPPGPVVSTADPTSVSGSGATMQGSIDDKGNAGKYTFSWSATIPGSSGCSGAVAPVTGSVTGNLAARNGAQSLSALFSQPLPAGSQVSYSLQYDTTIAGFATHIGGGQKSFTTGTFSPDGAGQAVIESATSVVLAANVPQFSEVQTQNVVDPVWAYGSDSAGGPAFTGTETSEYGVFQYSTPTSSAIYAGNTYLAAQCGNLTTVTLTGLQPGTKYFYSPDQAYGIGNCPASIPGPSYSDPAQPITNVDQVGGVNWCWIGSQQELAGYLDGGFGEYNTGGTNYFAYQPDYPYYVGPFLGNTSSGFTGTSPYPPIVVANSTFTTAVTTAPTNPTVSGSGVSDGLGCTTGSSCAGTQTLKYAVSYAPAAHGAGAAAARSREIVLGQARFSIRPHRHKTIHVHFSPAGKRFLASDARATNVLLVIVEHAGHGQQVTLTRLLALKPRPGRRAHRR
jgi:hypothetical protein